MLIFFIVPQLHTRGNKLPDWSGQVCRCIQAKAWIHCIPARSIRLCQGSFSHSLYPVSFSVIMWTVSLQNRPNFLGISGEQRRKRGERELGFFSDPPLAHNSRFALASLPPLFARNTQKITPVLQASCHWFYMSTPVLNKESQHSCFSYHFAQVSFPRPTINKWLQELFFQGRACILYIF